jgi:hypothetical protein
LLVASRTSHNCFRVVLGLVFLRSFFRNKTSH